jgi:hypothetical protein
MNFGLTSDTAKERPALLALVMVGCLLSACMTTPGYGPGDPAEMRAFLEEQAILRLDEDGEVDPPQTILAMVQWSRMNMAHTFDSRDGFSKAGDVIELLERHRQYGYVTVDGCWGATSVFQHLLGSVGIEVDREVIHIEDGVTNGMHSRADFPALQRTSLHMDDVYMQPISSGHDIPPVALLAPISELDAHLAGEEDGRFPIWRHRARIAHHFVPDVMVSFRALNARLGFRGGYGDYPTQEEIDASPVSFSIVDLDALIALDQRIDELGGVDAALETLREFIDRDSVQVDQEDRRGVFRTDYLPLRGDELFSEEE